MRNWSSAIGENLVLLKQLHSSEDRITFVRAFFFALLVPALVRLRLDRLADLLERQGRPRIVASKQEPTREKAENLVRCVDVALQVGRPWIRPGCLTRGLTLYYVLKRAGLDIQLCFGMGQVEGEWVGHCWLANEGVPFAEPRDPRPHYQVIYRIPGTVASPDHACRADSLVPRSL